MHQLQNIFKKIQTIILATVQGGSAKLALGKDGTRRDIES